MIYYDAEGTRYIFFVFFFPGCSGGDRPKSTRVWSLAPVKFFADCPVALALSCRTCPSQTASRTYNRLQILSSVSFVQSLVVSRTFMP